MNTNSSREDVSSELTFTLEEWARSNGINTHELKDKFTNISPRDERIIALILNRPVISCYMERVEAAWANRDSPDANNYFKNDSKAKEYRLQGDEHFTGKRYHDALYCYNQALRFANFERNVSSEGNELILTYIARSGLLFDCEQWPQAIADIKMALKYGCPRVELDERRKQCEAKLAQEKQLAESSGISKSGEGKSAEDEIVSELAGLGIGSSSTSTSTTTNEMPMEEPEPTIRVINTKMPAVSIKVTETVDPKRGRGLKTIDKVQFGEILAKESPYAHTLFIDCFGDYCQSCCKPLDGHTIPCPGCSIVQYCSRDCKKADKVHWKYTCHPQLPHIYDPLIQLMLRIICKSFMPEVRSPLQVKSKSSSSKSQPSTSKTSPNNQGVVIPKLGILIPHIFLHYHRLLVNKIFLVDQMEPITLNTSPVSVDERGEKIGLAIYPTLALINHECVPNVFLFFHGPKAIIRASRTIEPEKELSLCYGPSFASDTYKDRQRKLFDWYYFNCECEVCSTKSTSFQICYKCPKCSKALVVNEDETNECTNCDSINILEPNVFNLITETINEMNRGRSLFEKGELEEAVKILSKCYNQMDDHLYRSNCNLIRSRTYLADCLTAMGHHRMASKLTAVNVNVTGEICGWESVDYVCVMITYLSLMYKDLVDIWDEGDAETITSRSNQIICLIDEQIERINRLTRLVDPSANPSTVFNQEINSLNGIKEQTQRILSQIETNQ
ncbi:SET and MYND domain-containing protein 4-like [Panonychus citri]|uniref:SET and MYND domain-containing protein 4-like n=1 Tax=Panonychus citri TaxID=50023 RepID=UPI0023070163|nr:SET and MYND domain-containing protein 4-like [Panonychus citri]